MVSTLHVACACVWAYAQLPTDQPQLLPKDQSLRLIADVYAKKMREDALSDQRAEVLRLDQRLGEVRVRPRHGFRHRLRAGRRACGALGAAAVSALPLGLPPPRSPRSLSLFVFSPSSR